MELSGIENTNNGMSWDIQIWCHSQSRDNYLSSLNEATATLAFHCWVQVLTSKVKKRERKKEIEDLF